MVTVSVAFLTVSVGGIDTSCQRVDVLSDLRFCRWSLKVSKIEHSKTHVLVLNFYLKRLEWLSVRRVFLSYFNVLLVVKSIRYSVFCALL